MKGIRFRVALERNGIEGTRQINGTSPATSEIGFIVRYCRLSANLQFGNRQRSGEAQALKFPGAGFRRRINECRFISLE